MDARTANFRRNLNLLMLFAVVGVLVCWLNYSLLWIRERHGLLESRAVIQSGYNPPGAPGLLWLFGESGFDTLEYLPVYADEDEVVPFFVLRGNKPRRTLSESEIRRAEAAFPEAHLRSFIGR